MEPLSLIVAALLAGAAAAAKDTTSTAIKDGYQGLKVLIERKLAGQPAAVKALAAAIVVLGSWRGVQKCA